MIPATIGSITPAVWPTNGLPQSEISPQAVDSLMVKLAKEAREARNMERALQIERDLQRSKLGNSASRALKGQRRRHGKKFKPGSLNPLAKDFDLGKQGRLLQTMRDMSREIDRQALPTSRRSRALQRSRNPKTREQNEEAWNRWCQQGEPDWIQQLREKTQQEGAPAEEQAQALKQALDLDDKAALDAAKCL